MGFKTVQFFKFTELVFKLPARACGALSLISAHLSTNQLFISACKQRRPYGYYRPDA